MSGVHLDFQIHWTPEYFIQRYGSENCHVEDCETGLSLPGYTVERFFGAFGKQRSADEPILRLKVGHRSIITTVTDDAWLSQDWPPSDRVDDIFPDLLHDFVNAVPMPDYCAPHGVFNIAAHFPHNAVRPDLGKNC